MTTIIRPRLPVEPSGTPTTTDFVLERRLRRADNACRLMVEAHRIVRGDIKRRKEQFDAADALTGLEVLSPPRYGVTLSGTPGTIVSHTVAGDGYITDLDTSLPHTVCRVRFGGTQAPERLLRRIIAKLHPANGGAKNVEKWRCELYLATEVNSTDFPGPLLWAPLAIAVDVVAGPSEADVTFDFADQQLAPAAFGAPGGDGNETAPLMYVLIKALKSDGSPATNVGWRRDSTTASDTEAGITSEARTIRASDGTYLEDVDDAANGTPIITIDAQSSFAESILAFTGANKPDLGGVPAAASNVVFTMQGERPNGTKIKAEARVGGADAWIEVKDGQTAADVGLAASQTYQMRATLSPNAALDVAPILTDLGVQEVTRTDLSHIATVSGGGWGFDPVTLRGMIPEITITAIQDGERDFRDAITDLLSSTHIGDLWFRVYVMADDLSRHHWYHIDDFYPDHVEGIGGALVIRAINVLGMLKQALPKYDAVNQKREKLSYANATLKSAYSDLLKNQIALKDRHIGPMVEAAGTADILTKEITDSDGKVELDAVAFRAGGAVLGYQGKVAFVDVHGSKGAILFLGIEDIAQETVTPGWSQAVPSFYADYDYDFAAQQFRKQHRGINQLAFDKLGQRALDRVEFLDQEIAKGIPAGPGGDLERHVKPIVERQITTLGTGMITLDFRTAYAYPELWPGDMVAVRTDRLVARSPTDDRAIKGYTWVLGVISERRDLWGTQFRLWVRRYSDILASTSSVTIGDTLQTDSFTGASFRAESATAAGSIAAYEYRNRVLALPSGLWRSALYDDDSLRLQKNTAVAGDFSTLTEICRWDPSGKGLHIGSSYTAPPPLGLRTEGDVVSELEIQARIGGSRATIGDVGHGASFAAFAHGARFNVSDYALLHQDTGATYLNAAATQLIRLRIANVDEFTLSATAADFQGNAVSMGALTATSITATTGPLVVGAALSLATPIGLFYNKDAAGAVIGWRRSDNTQFAGIGSDGFSALRFYASDATTTRANLDAAAFYPGTAGGLTLGTAALPWKDPRFGFDASNRLDITISSAGAVTYDAVGSGALHTFSDDLTIGSLGRFDSADTPTDMQLLVYKEGIGKWQAEAINWTVGTQDFKATLLADGTAVAYVLETLSPADGAVNAPGTPTVTLKHLSVELRIPASYVKTANFKRFKWETCTGAGCTGWTHLTYTTSLQLVHARVTSGQVRRYQVRAESATTVSAFATTGDNTVIAGSDTEAFGGIVAGNVVAVDMAALVGDFGIVKVGQMRNEFTNPTSVINFGGKGGIPSTVKRLINFEDTALPTWVDGESRAYFNLFQGGAAGNTMLRHDHFELRYTGTPLAIFRGIAQETDTSPKFKIDFPGKLLTITDEQTPTPQVRVKLGKFGVTNDYGLEVYDAGAGLLMKAGRGPTSVWGVSQDRVEIGRNPTSSAMYMLTRPGIGAIGSGGAYYNRPQVWLTNETFGGMIGSWRLVVDDSGNLRVERNTSDIAMFSNAPFANFEVRPDGVIVLNSGYGAAPTVAYSLFAGRIIGTDTLQTEQAAQFIMRVDGAVTRVRVGATSFALMQAASGTQSHLWAHEAYNEITAAGTVTEMRGFFTQLAMLTGAGTITNYRAVSVATPVKNAGTLTNAYGLYIETFDKGTTNYAIFTAGVGNIAFFGGAGLGGGAEVISIANATTVPSSNPTGGGILYAEAGAGKWRGSSGTVTTFGPAEPHCPTCKRDFALSWENEQYGKLVICAWCAFKHLEVGIIERRAA